MKNQANKKALLAAYRVPGFRAQARVDSYDDHLRIFVITLTRRQKKRYAAAAEKDTAVFTTGAGIVRVVLTVATARSTSILRCVAWIVRRAAA